MPGGSYPANPFGLHDVHGNVSEWVEDCWNESYAGAPSDGRAWESGECGLRVVRGGHRTIRVLGVRSSAYRAWASTGEISFRGNNYGFRVARTLTP